MTLGLQGFIELVGHEHWPAYCELTHWDVRGWTVSVDKDGCTARLGENKILICADNCTELLRLVKAADTSRLT